MAQVVQPSLAKEEEDDPLFGCPQEDIVVCVDGGSEVGGSHVTCQAACDGKCCDYEGADACTGFTGRVCKDGYSCTGLDACKDADIDLVVGGCRGDAAYGIFGVCENADIKRGVIRGCIGDGSCYFAGSTGAGNDDGYVGRIKDGCVGDKVLEKVRAVELQIMVVLGSSGMPARGGVPVTKLERVHFMLEAQEAL